MEDTIDLARLKLELRYYTTDFSVASVTEGDFLKQEDGTTFFTAGQISSDKVEGVEIIRLTGGSVNGSGVLVSITFKGNTIGYGGGIYFDAEFLTPSGESIPHTEQSYYALEVVASWDVNGDGEVTVTDLLVVANKIGEYDKTADLTGDGRVTVEDFVIVASHLGESMTSDAPSIVTKISVPNETIQEWIDMAHAANDGSLAFQRGISNLELLLKAMHPDVTALLPNYPNPFNPETWIPYHLAHTANVVLTIYDTKGVIVRRLDLGHQTAGIYQSKSRAAYWDGRNSFGERIASGLYFYTLTAGDFTATRKMLIRK